MATSPTPLTATSISSKKTCCSRWTSAEKWASLFPSAPLPTKCSTLAAASVSPTTISSPSTRSTAAWEECPNETVSHQSSRCAESRRPHRRRRLDQHASPVPHRPENRRLRQTLDRLDGPSPRRAPRQAPPPKLRRILRRDSRHWLHLHRRRPRTLVKRRRHFHAPRPLARLRQHRHRKRRPRLGMERRGLAGSRRLRNSPRGLLIQGPIFKMPTASPIAWEDPRLSKDCASTRRWSDF